VTHTASTLAELLERFRVPVKSGGAHRSVRRGWIGIDCPFCSPGSGTFYLGLSGGSANCWRCGPLKLPDVLRALDVPDRDARAVVKALWAARSPLPTRRTGVFTPPAFGRLRAVHKAYLRGRGFDPDELVRLWRVGGIGLVPERDMSWRVYIPVTWRGKDVSWTTRSVGDDNPLRWMTSPPDRESLFHKHLLFGWDYVRHAAVVHEGCTDVFRTGPGAVGTFGVGYSEAQVALLASLAVRVICFDAEPKAQRRADRLADELSVFPGDTYVVRLDSPDPGSATPREVKHLRSYLA
jgi:hypothetical protein